MEGGKTRAVPVAKEILDVVVTHENKIDWEKPRERKIDPPTTTTLYRSDLLFLDGGSRYIKRKFFLFCCKKGLINTAIII